MQDGRVHHPQQIHGSARGSEKLTRFSAQIYGFPNTRIRERSSSRHLICSFPQRTGCRTHHASAVISTSRSPPFSSPAILSTVLLLSPFLLYSLIAHSHYSHGRHDRGPLVSLRCYTAISFLGAHCISSNSPRKNALAHLHSMSLPRSPRGPELTAPT